LYAFLISPTHITFPTNFILLDMLIIIIYFEKKFSLVSYFLSLLGSSIPFSALFQNTHSLHSSPSMGDLVLTFCNMLFLWWVVVKPLSWRTIPHWLSATVYSVYFQLPSISEGTYLTRKCWVRSFILNMPFFSTN
jgi:hypothetical protein